MRILIDTNAYSALVEGQPEIGIRVREAKEVLISTWSWESSFLGFTTVLDMSRTGTSSTDSCVSLAFRS